MQVVSRDRTYISVTGQLRRDRGSSRIRQAVRRQDRQFRDGTGSLWAGHVVEAQYMDLRTGQVVQEKKQAIQGKGKHCYRGKGQAVQGQDRKSCDRRCSLGTGKVD